MPTKKLTPGKPSPKNRMMDMATGRPLERAIWPLKDFNQEDLHVIATLRFPSNKTKQQKWISRLKEAVELEPEEYWAVFRNYSDRHYRTELDSIEKDLLAKESSRQDLSSYVQQVQYMVSRAREELKDPQAFRSAAILAINSYKEFISIIEKDFQLGKKRRAAMKVFGKKQGSERHKERQVIHDDWRNKAHDILKTRPTLSKHSLAGIIKERFSIPDSIETIRKRI